MPRAASGFRTTIIEKLSELFKSINSSLSSEDLKNLATGMDGKTLAVGKVEFDAVIALVHSLAGEVESLSSQLKTKITTSTAEINAQLKIVYGF